MLTDQMIADALPNLRASAKRLTRDEDATQDLLQDTFVTAARFKCKFRGECSLPTWLQHIMRSLCFKQKQKHCNLMTDYVAPDEMPDQIAASNVELQVDAIQVLARLDRMLKDPLHRQIFTSTVLGDSGDEIHAATGVSHVTIRTRTARIRAALNERVAA
jgi:RNA polymerase sigma factor (sigma-70 family)